MENIANIELKLKEVIINSLNLEDYAVDDIVTEAPLFGDGLGLDSIDALELGIAIKREFSLSDLDVDSNIKEHFFSVKKLALYIYSLRLRTDLKHKNEV